MSETTTTDTTTTTTDAGTTTTTPGAAVLSDTPYYASFKDEGTRKFAEAFKTPEELASHAAKFGAFKDADPANLVALPKDAADEAAKAALYDRLGRPKEAADYGVSKIEGVNTEFAGQAEAIFHKIGLNNDQAKALADFYLGFEKTADEAFQKSAATAAQAEINQVRQELGDAKLEGGRRFAKALGITQEQLSAIEGFTGAGQLLRIFATASEKVGEHFYEDGKGGTSEDKTYAGRLGYSQDYIASLNGGQKTTF
jgi:hypothetical protein